MKGGYTFNKTERYRLRISTCKFNKQKQYLYNSNKS